MRIALVTPGAAGMYCGSCLHDNTLAAALGRLGHDVSLVPMYTPIRTDETDVSDDHVFFGAINVYLQHKSPLFRHTPRAIAWLLDRPALLDRISGLGASTNPAELGPLTLSTLQGEAGPLSGELDRLTTWLRDEIRPEVVHLSNSMLLGFAAAIKRELGVPVVCSVQGEDLFLDALEPPWHDRVMAELRRRATDVDCFIAPSHYYAQLMAGYLAIPPARVEVVQLGIRLDGADAADAGRAGGPDPGNRPFVIGYLARIAPEKGLHQLTAAFIELAGRSERALLLRVAGYLGPRDRAYLDELTAALAAARLGDRFRYVGEVDRAGKREFLRGLDVMALPTVYREAKGLPVLEAMAAGVPVVVPAHGSFPEIIAATGGGRLFEPGSTSALARELESLLNDGDERRRLGQVGQRKVRASYSDVAMAEATVAVYRKFVTGS